MYITILDFASGLVFRIEVFKGMRHEEYEEIIKFSEKSNIKEVSFKEKVYIF